MRSVLMMTLTFALVSVEVSSSAIAQRDDATVAKSERPNFVIIMADDLGYGDISPYGGWINTPHLQDMARQGMRFTDYHSSGNVCSPTRAGLLTGRYQQRAGITGVVFADRTRDVHYHGLQPQENTFAEMLAAAGYRTALFGKWHLGYYPKYNPVHHGFDEFRGYVSGNVDFFSHIDQDGQFDWWQQDQLKDEAGYTTHLISRHAVRFIEEHADRPFCLYLPHEAPHAPYQGPHDKAERSVDGKFETSGARSDVRNAYREMVQEMDTGIGEVLTTLRRLKIDRRTLVVFCSDNGANQKGVNKPLRGFKGSDWEGGHRVPCIAWWPGRIEPGTETDQLAICLDLMPTMLAAAGIESPTDRPLDGVSLLPVLDGGESQTRQLFWNGKAMRDGAWKLIVEDKGENGTGLYDLSTDLGESRNVAAEHPDRTRQMLAALQAWQKSVDADRTPQPSSQSEADQR